MIELFCKHKDHPDWYGKMCIVGFCGTGYNNYMAICLNKNGDLKAFDIKELLAIDENEVTEND